MAEAVAQMVSLAIGVSLWVLMLVVGYWVVEAVTRRAGR